VANRIVTVGDHYRAFQIAEFFDKVTAEDLNVQQSGPYEIKKPHLFMYMSKRKFLTITGTYKGVPVSVVAICMVNIIILNIIYINIILLSSYPNECLLVKLIK